MLATRLSLATYNLWHTYLWNRRALAVKNFLDAFRPDVLCVQELRPETRKYLDRVLSGNYARIEDPFEGWVCESNIYWNKYIFEEVEHGAESVGILEEYRRLFWARLRLIETNQSLLIGTIHLTWQSNQAEMQTGKSPRLEQIRRTVNALSKLEKIGEPVFLLGDLNDVYHPIRILQESGYTDCFGDLSLMPPPTTPTPIAAKIFPRVTLDWIFANSFARCILAQSPRFYAGGIGSDHWPVIAMYEIGG